MNKQTEALNKAMFMATDIRRGITPSVSDAILLFQACKEALEQEERTQRTMHCGTVDAFIAMDDEHKRRWFVQSLRESQRRKELEDMLEQPAQKPYGYEKDGVFYYKKPDDVFIYQPLYTHPCVLTHSAPSWQGFTDDEVKEIMENLRSPYAQIRTAEIMLKEKNT